MLSVALLDLHRQLPAHDQGVQQRGPAGRVPAVLRPRRGAAHVRDRAAARRLQHRDDGQVPQRVRPGQGQRPRTPVHLCAARLVGVGRGRLGLPGVRLLAQRRRHGRQLRPQALGLPDRRDGQQGRRLHQQLGRGWKAVLPRAGHVRPARSVHAGATRRQRLPRAAGSAPTELQRAPDQRAALARRPATVDGRPAEPDQHRLPAAGAVGAGRRPDDRTRRGGAGRQRAESTTPTSCSAPTTACTPANTG